MIPFHDIDKPHTYAYVAGCRNAAWIVGKLHHVDAPNKRMMITRAGEDSIIPVDFEGGDRIPNDYKEGDAVKLICHVYSGIREGAEDDVKAGRHSRLVAKYIGRPTLLDMRPRDDFSAGVEDESIFDNFDLPEAFTPVSNSLELAGFVDGTPVLVRDQEHEKDRLVFMLRQSPNPQSLIPIEIAGKHAALYRKIVMVGMAVFINGIVLPGKRSDTGEPVAVVRSNHVRKADPSKDFKFEAVPDWAVEIRRRYAAHVQQEKARLAALAAARQAESLLG
jgi:hypothetical protein